MNDIKHIRKKVEDAIKIRRKMHDIFRKYDVHMGYNDDPINPYYNQSRGDCEGFTCEYYYSSPAKIYTPLGELRIISGFFSPSDNALKAIDEIKDVFGFKLMEEAESNSIGIFGPWHHITKLPWVDNELKCDSELKLYPDYIDYDKARELYNEIIKRIDIEKIYL